MRRRSSSSKRRGEKKDVSDFVLVLIVDNEVLLFHLEDFSLDDSPMHVLLANHTDSTTSFSLPARREPSTRHNAAASFDGES